MNQYFFRISHDRLKDIAKELCEIFPGELSTLYFHAAHRVTDDIGDSSRVNATGILYRAYLAKRSDLRKKADLLTTKPKPKKTEGIVCCNFHTNEVQ